METKSALREHIINEAVASFPKALLVDLQRRAEVAYPDTFAQVDHDPAILPEHRINKLRQDRCFRMDFELKQAMEGAGFACSAKPLTENDWKYTYGVCGNFGVTQSYVQKIGDLPNSAKFRDQLADASRVPRLPLDDDPALFAPRQFYGLFTHNSVGREFTEDSQKLGSMQFCVPCEGMKAWAVLISLPELISMYPEISAAKVATPTPKWKDRVADRAVGGT